jgi:hypothetical protein
VTTLADPGVAAEPTGRVGLPRLAEAMLVTGASGRFRRSDAERGVVTLNPRPGPGTAGLFDQLAARYDAWYDGPAGAAAFPSEAHCLRPLLIGLPRPWTEIGTGSGRFAAALGMDVGLDDGAVILGMVFADSSWGRFYQHKAVGEHPFYAAARFLTGPRRSRW